MPLTSNSFFTILATVNKIVNNLVYRAYDHEGCGHYREVAKGGSCMREDCEPIHDIAHLGHIELLTPKLAESFWFFHDTLGMQEAAREGQSVYLRGWGEYERYSLKLTEAKQAGVAHTAFRAMSPQALERRVHALEASGLGRGWIDGDVGHGRAYQFTDPDGHLLELYYDSEKYRAPEDLRPALKNQPQRTPDHGNGVRRLDHINFLARSPVATRTFMQERLGA